MNLHEERLSGKHIFKGRVIDLEVDQIRLPDGHDSIREVINHPGRRGHRRPERTG